MAKTFGLFALVFAFGLTAGCSKNNDVSDASDAEYGSGYADEELNESSAFEDTEAVDTSDMGTGDMPANLPVVYFDFDEASLTSDSRSKLQAASSELMGTSVDIVVEGHCDERGSNEYNLALGERRARTVRDYLQSLGVTGARMEIISYGEERPVAFGSTESAYSQNRRAEITIMR